MVDEDDSNEWEETQYESLDWGEEDRSQSRLIEVYHSTNKAAQAALVLIVAGIVLLGTAMSLNDLRASTWHMLPHHAPSAKAHCQIKPSVLLAASE